MKKKAIISIVLVMVLISSAILIPSVLADDEFYAYPITIESDDWLEYSVLEKQSMLSIDDSTVKGMSDEQLVHAVADFPYLVDIYVFDSIETGLDELKKTCDAYRELSGRDSFVPSMTKYGTALIEYYTEFPRSDGRTDFVITALKDIIDAINKNRSTDLFQNLHQNFTRAVPQTPNGNSVPYTTPSEPHSVINLYHYNIDNEMVNTYGVTLISSGSCKYNCHSYAWHSTASSNPYWISYPGIYMSDGSYALVYQGSLSSAVNNCGISTNDKVFYGANSINNMHSAIFVDYSNSGVPVATAKVRSKWGQAGVFQHSLTNVPAAYSTSNISFWH